MLLMSWLLITEAAYQVIRHCVAIDERRAKFRQDLIYQSSARRGSKNRLAHADHDHDHDHDHDLAHVHEHEHDEHQDEKPNGRLSERYRVAKHKGGSLRPQDSSNRGREPHQPSQRAQEESTFRPRSRSRVAPSADDASFIDTKSDVSRVLEDDECDDSDDDDQDIDEIWYVHIYYSHISSH